MGDFPEAAAHSTGLWRITTSVRKCRMPPQSQQRHKSLCCSRWAGGSVCERYRALLLSSCLLAKQTQKSAESWVSGDRETECCSLPPKCAPSPYVLGGVWCVYGHSCTDCHCKRSNASQRKASQKNQRPKVRANSVQVGRAKWAGCKCCKLFRRPAKDTRRCRRYRGSSTPFLPEVAVPLPLCGP